MTLNQGTVDSLLNCAMYAVAKYLPTQGYDMTIIPHNVKERMTYLLCKRGLVSDDNINACVYSGLREIDLSECVVTDGALEVLAQSCPRMLKVDLNATKGKREEITTVGVIAMAEGCKFLQNIFLRRCVHVNDDAMLCVAQNCRLLKQLNVGGCPQIIDKSLEALGNYSEHLASLNVSGTSITDNGVQNLCSGIPKNSLAELHMNNCLNLTDESVNNVIRFCPSIKILLLHGCPRMTEATRVAIDQLAAQMRQVTWTIY